MTINEIARMSKIERLQTMEALWDSLIHESTEIDSPEWHQDVLSDRREKIKGGEARFMTIDELKTKHEK